MGIATDISFAERGKEILDFARGADRDKWANEWARPDYAIGAPEDCWTQFTLTSVDDFNAELGFLVGALGLDVFMLQEKGQGEATFTMAMLAPRADKNPSFIIGIRESDEDHPAAPAGSTQFEFMTQDLPTAWQRMVDAGAEVISAPYDDGWMDRACVRTPAGFDVQLWSLGDRR